VKRNRLPSLTLLATIGFALASAPHGNAQAQAQRPDTTGAKGSSTVVKERVAGSIRFPGEQFLRITGKVKVINSHTLTFEDGTEVELNGTIDAAEPEQKGLIGDKLYPCGKEAAEFLQKLIGDQPVTCFTGAKSTNRLRGDCFVGEKKLQIELVRNGWAIARHSTMEEWEVIARENKRGLWRGQFVLPERWRKGERLPGE
jgi:endonuclease YncB( thermonuclease family)